ncbi:MAG TPA: DUF1549 and DUF1553 domain-containing protein [Tepidisphaeraceae bacterium]
MSKLVRIALPVLTCLMGVSILVRADQPTTAPAGVISEKSREFWCFRPVTNPSLPVVQDASWCRNPVDRFVLSKLEEQHLRPAPPATKIELVRRVYFDVTGLPPSPVQIKAFVSDPAPDAYERLVDQLLASPHFGERAAQHWLDVVRYAETEGFEYDRHLPDAWRYRDYVVSSFNNDKPFDRFVTEQIAGDEIAPGNPECETAAIFHRLGPVRRNAGNPEVAASRNEVLTERTDIIGAAFLGLTIGCARCHDHKFDPILQKDYYRLQAYLSATEEHDILLAPDEEKKEWQRKTLAINNKIKALQARAKSATGSDATRLKEEIETLEDSLPANPATIPGIGNDFAHRAEIHVLHRGDWEKKLDLVGPRPPTVLVSDDLPELAADDPAPRTQLARWLTDPHNPLTPRVIVNRLWQDHFGRGIVNTANNFGINGERPTHPELLDFLANQLLQNGWRLKPLHRLILLSNAYRQSSRSTIEQSAMRIDPEDRLLWRFPKRRLSAEEIRDAMLAATGQLNPKIGGPSVMLPVDPELTQQLYKPSQWQVSSNLEDQHRRSIYLIAKRNLRLPFMDSFDQPALTTSCSRRESSTHAPQALELLNGRLANELALALAARLEQDCGHDRAQIIEKAYQLTLGRSPTDKERGLAAQFLKDQPLKEFALALFNLNGFLYVQ